MIEGNLNIGGGVRPLIKREVVVHFDKEDHPMVKSKPIEMANVKEIEGNDKVMFMQELSWIYNNI